jgi:hypothetical protein
VSSGELKLGLGYGKRLKVNLDAIRAALGGDSGKAALRTSVRRGAAFWSCRAPEDRSF